MAGLQAQPPNRRSPESNEFLSLFIESGSRWENGNVESFNGKQWDEPLNGESFGALLEDKVLIERWSVEYNPIRRTVRRGIGSRS